MTRIDTVDQLNALPIGSIVRKAPEETERTNHPDGPWSQGAVAELRLDAAGRPAWFFVGSSLGWKTHQAGLVPATLLFVPGRDLVREKQATSWDEGRQWLAEQWGDVETHTDPNPYRDADDIARGATR